MPFSFNDKFEYETGSLIFPEKEISIEARLGEKIKGLFHIISGSDLSAEGTILAETWRISCDRADFNGESVEVHYDIDVEGLDKGDQIHSGIVVLSDRGEYRIPVKVSIVKDVVDSSVGRIDNLFHFTNLARADFEEATKIFYTLGFVDIFRGSDKRFRNDYRAFSEEKNEFSDAYKSNVEEFLVAVRKKVPMTFSVLQNEVSIENLTDGGEQRGKLGIMRSGWGYTSLTIQSDTDFLVPLVSHITDDDFDGNKAFIPYEIEWDLLHAGRNYAALNIKNGRNDIKVTFSVSKATPKSIESKSKRQVEKLFLDLEKEYIKFRSHKSKSAQWCMLSLDILGNILAIDRENTMARILKTQFLILEGKRRDAEYFLNHLRREFDFRNATDEEMACFHYVKACFTKNIADVKKAAEDVSKLLKANPGSSLILLILIFTDEELGKNLDYKLWLLRRCFETGSRSPLIYMEAISIFIARPALVSKISEFELQILTFGIKYGIVSEKLILTIVRGIETIKYFDRLLMKISDAYYERYKSDELLYASCVYLISHQVIDSKYFPWYSRGVARELKITRLYEYYMETLPDTFRGILPREIILYFSMGSELPDKKQAAFYANLIRYGNSNGGNVLYSLAEQILEFAIRSAKERCIDKNYCLIYEFVNARIEADGKNNFYKNLGDLVFCHQIVTNDKNIKRIILIEDQFVEARAADVENGTAIVTIYGGDYSIYFEDEDGNRLSYAEGCKDIALFNVSYFTDCLNLNSFSSIGAAFWLCGAGRRYMNVSDENIDLIRFVLKSDELTREYRMGYVTLILQYYYDNNKMDELDDFLSELETDVASLDASLRGELIRFLCIRDEHERAYALIRKNGTEHVDPKVTVRLASRVISDRKDDPRLVCICFEAFRAGKYDEEVLSYLVSHYQGTARNLRDIWLAARRFGVPCEVIEERILNQVLLTRIFIGERDDIFKSYVKRGASSKVEYAYLTYSSYEFFVKGRVTDEFIFEHLISLAMQGEEIPEICALAITSHYADKSESDISPRIRKVIIQLIRKLLKSGIIFEYFKNFEFAKDELLLYEDRTFIEYRTEPNRKVMLYYRILDEGREEDTDYRREELQSLIGGIYVRQFVLFSNEMLQYHITEEEDGTEQTVISDKAVPGKWDEKAEKSRYNLINEIIYSAENGNEFYSRNLISDYKKKDNAVMRMFTLK